MFWLLGVRPEKAAVPTGNRRGHSLAQPYPTVCYSLKGTTIIRIPTTEHARPIARKSDRKSAKTLPLVFSERSLHKAVPGQGGNRDVVLSEKSPDFSCPSAVTSKFRKASSDPASFPSSADQSLRRSRNP